MKTIFWGLLLFALFGCQTSQHLSDSTSKKPVFEAAQNITPLYMTGKKVVMISHPGCHFCQKAFSQFTPAIQKYFKTNAIFLTPLADENFEAHARVVDEWNAQSEYKHIIIHMDAILPQIPNLKSTPQFHFFNNGKIVERIQGWRPGTETLIEDAIHHLEKVSLQN
ncbi:MAG: hypothetical protein K2Q26_15160 [Bdellovibrionales bacterium]|nr:hypothetical protein [Bdellovibrionales bacterium]